MRHRSHVAALLALVAVTLLACGGREPGAEPGPTGGANAGHFTPRPDADLLLITIDTLRADAPGFAGGDAVTPMLDRLAAEGLVFPRAHAHNVMTLPSHSNLLTGLLPYQHGVRENSGYTLPDGLPTLATLLQEDGWATAAIVGAFPLDARFGLDRGFEVYDDRIAKASAGDVFGLAERQGTEVVARALEWWRAQAGRQRFLWVHLFEPHAPYAPPSPFAERYADRPYLGEVAAADAALAPLLTPIFDSDEPVFVVFTSDHGEGLGDHGELTHGIFAYESTLAVPLVIWGPGIAPGIDRRLARHVDVLPTALAALDRTPPADLPGSSLLSPVAEDSPADSYFEALTGALARGWAPLRGTIRGSQKMVELPVPELYDLEADPEEKDNLFDERRDDARQLVALLPTESEWPPARGTVTPEVEAELRSLGYLGGSVPARDNYGPEDDPKNLIGLDRKLHRLNGLYAAGRLEDVVRLGHEILTERPNLALAATYLAQALLDLGRPRQAVEVLESARAAGAENDTLLRQLGLALTWSGRAAEAVALLEPVAERAGPATLNVLGAALVQSGQPERATEVLEGVFDVDPTNARACENLSAAAIARELWSEATEWAGKALELDDKLPNAWNNLGVGRYYLGDGPGALEAWQRALNLNPRQFDTLFNLGLKAAELGETDLARRALRRFLDTAPPGPYAPALEDARRLLAQLEPGSD